MMSGDNGVPVLESSPDSAPAKAILDVTKSFKKQLKRVVADAGDQPVGYERGADGRLHMEWSDGTSSQLDAYHLRLYCPCAACIDEDTGKRMLDPKAILLDVGIKDIQPIGNYAIALDFSDGHNTGIYKWDYLLQLAQASAESDKKTFSI
jgi:DUF971 family protein